MDNKDIPVLGWLGLLIVWIGLGFILHFMGADRQIIQSVLILTALFIALPRSLFADRTNT